VSEKAKRREFILEGLGCANCAAKMEIRIRSLEGIKEASIDFVSKKLRYEVYNEAEASEALKKVEEVVKGIEGHVELREVTQGKAREKDSEDGKSDIRSEMLRLAFGAALYAAALVFEFNHSVELALFLISYALVGIEVLVKSVRNIRRGQVFDENFLMGIATIGAFAIGEFAEGVAVMLFYQIGELFQDAAVNRSRKSIKELMDIRPDYANLKAAEGTIQTAPEKVKIGDIIIIKPGEKVPLDGKVVGGKSMLDTSALTGESVPREIKAGDEILSGFINKNGVLEVEVTKEYSESTVSRILYLVENASSKKAPTENFITKFARYYTPAVVLIALVLAVIPPLTVSGATFSEWIYRALIFLVVSCPCALVISIPLGFFGGIGGASRNGILIKGSNYLEALNAVDTVVFDKTGTLTKGVFEVTEIKTSGELSQQEILEYAAYAESFSNHPIAASIIKAFAGTVDKEQIESYEEVSGHGIRAMVKGREVLAGNGRLMEKEGIVFEEPDLPGTTVHIAVDRVYAGYLLISDEAKDNAVSAIQQLKKAGIKQTVMLTGDIKSVAETIANKLNIDRVYSELLPDQKVEKLEMLYQEKKSKGKLAFVGDGINDAPVLARADVGIAMGGLGSDAAIEAADIVIMNDEPSKIVSAIKIAKWTRRIVWQNIIFAMGVKIVVLMLSAGGLATMWAAVFADVGVALIAILNAMRVLNIKNV
jgi:Cd2+/Zn2+-exporting ATPase